MINLIAFDADDTLWHNESLYNMTQSRFAQLLSPYCSAEIVEQSLYETEMRNLNFYGYGIKSFTLSMIETAIELSEGQVCGQEIQEIINFARWMLTEPIELLDGVKETVLELSKEYRLMIITKGDLFDQESKVARSGLADYFGQVEIVSQKTPEVYQSLLEKHNIAPKQFLMVGNSLPSDVLPVVEIGGQAVHIPYHITWQHETVTDQSAQQGDYFELNQIAALPAVVARINNPENSA